MAESINLTAQLVQKVRSGDHEAFEQLYRLTQQSAYFVALKITGNEDDALDILQDSYIKALEKFDQLADDERFVPWFNRIVANSSKNYLIKAKPLLFDDDSEQEYADEWVEDDLDCNPEESLDTAEARKAVMELIDSLPEDKRLCVLMYYYDGLKSSEIAQALGIPENTVKSRLFESKKKIKEKIETLRKQGVSVLGTSAVPFFAWLLRRSAVSIVASEKAVEGVLTAILSTAAIAVGGTAVVGSVAAVSGVAKVIAAITVPKIIAAVTAVAVVTGGTAVGVKVARDKHSRAATTQSITEESATAVFKEVEQQTNSVEATAVSEESTAAQELTVSVTTAQAAPAASVPLATAAPRPTQAVTAAQKTNPISTAAHSTARPTATTAKPQPTTAKPTTTSKPVTTAKPTTTAKPVTTAKPTTTAKPVTTTPTTAKPTTTLPQVTDFTYTVSGSSVTINKYTGSASGVSVPPSIEGKPVTAIAAGAFANNSEISSVSLPSSISSVGTGAFQNCASLTQVNIPSSLTALPNNMFRGCSALESITIPATVTSIPASAFQNCPNLTIHCSAGSAAESYAMNNGIPFVAT